MILTRMTKARTANMVLPQWGLTWLIEHLCEILFDSLLNSKTGNSHD